MKKYLFSALALPLLFACSSEDFDEKVISNDQFAGIEKVDATFTMGETTRMATDWKLEEGDVYGLAWLQDGLETHKVTINGNAFQNHPLTQEDYIFKPATSIYTGKYYLYRPYDYTTVEPGIINFNSLAEQTITDGQRGDNWKALAKNAIVIGDKWTNVTKTGTTDLSGKVWDKAGINENGTKNNYNIYAATFSNQTGLDMTYKNNNVSFAGKAIAGATDINYTYPEDATVGAVDIYNGTVELEGAAKSFTYAPSTENMEPVKVAAVSGEVHSGLFWADKKDIGTSYGFTFASGAIALNAVTDEAPNGITATSNKGWIWFNSLPVTAGTGTKDTKLTTILNTSYGEVTVKPTVEASAYEYHNFGTATVADWQWVKLKDATDETKTPKEWNVGDKSTFINQYGNHHGKFSFEIDFKDAVMNGMHVRDDNHLQKLLKFYIASGKTENVSLNLDGKSSSDKTFKISKISIALIQTIKAQGHKVQVHACTTHNNPVKIIVTQDGQSDIAALANATEVPALQDVFDAVTDVYLASGTTWTWSGGGETAGWDDAITVDANVKSITNEGTLTVNATNVQLSEAGVKIFNAKDATMNITKVTTVKNALTNLGTINVNAGAELRAYGVAITNDATALNVSGTINNSGVVGVTAGTTPAGKFYNYGLIDMKNGNAITLLTSNEKGTDPFGAAWADGNKMGTVLLPNNNPTALVSVANTAENGFIKYTWPASTKTYATPEGNVKYNTIVVSGDIEFTAVESEIQYIEFNGVKTQVINAGSGTGKLSKLKGIIVRNEAKNASIIIEKGNTINCSVGAYLGEGATVYKGGSFKKAGAAFVADDATAAKNYLGEWSLDQIVEY